MSGFSLHRLFALLRKETIQVRRDAVGSSRAPLLADRVVNIAPGDIDHLAATLQHKVSRGKVYVSQP